MATAYKSTQLTAPVAPTPGVGLGGRTTHYARASFALTTALVINDTIDLFYLPRNSRVVRGFIKSADLDSNGTPLVTLDVGDAGVTNRFFAASTVGQAGGVDVTMAATGYDATFTARTLVQLLVKAAPATSATTGTIVVMIEYIVEEPA